MSDNVNSSVENFQFEPIKGEPRLHWQGKRAFESTNYFPAQLKEKYGKEKNGWMNKLFWGDNVQVMSHLLKDYRGKINLIYIDPPYDSKADYKKKIKLKNKKVNNDYTSFEEKQYSDIWSNDEYLQFMYDRLILLRELLAENGTIYLHSDWHKSHHLRCIMDEIFGESGFQSEIIWQRTGGHHLSTGFDVMTDTIYMYTKSPDFKFNTQYEKLSEEELDEKFPHEEEETGRRFNHEKLEKSSNSSSAGEKRIIQGKEVISDIGWVWTQETFDERLEKNPYAIYWTSNDRPRYKNYADEYEGRKIGNLWTDINPLYSNSSEREDYPTQKPEELLERIIDASTDPGDIVFDCFMGSGTTQAVAMKMGRKFLGADINLGAVQTTTSRLERIMSNSKNEEDKYLNFELYNVNNYDIFRNPTEAKELLIKALEINPLTRNNLYDGEKDGRMVKIMPINRIAAKADLNDLIANFPYKEFEKRKDKNPNQPVEDLLLVCMGHEPDLVANLEKEVNYNLDIEVVDILRDKKELTFKRDSEVDIDINNGVLEINNFYPLNLLQKLSLMKENVEEWKELVESILIDWDYNGEYLEPDVIDVPEDDELVKGRYMLPENVGEIRVKITDLLSEVLEVTANNE